MRDEYLEGVSATEHRIVMFSVKVAVQIDAQGRFTSTDSASISREEVARVVAALPPDLAAFESDTRHKRGHLRVKTYDSWSRIRGLDYLRIVKTTPKMIHCADGSKYRRATGDHVGGRGTAHPYDVKHAEALP
jgi:hypothetical protein